MFLVSGFPKRERKGNGTPLDQQTLASRVISDVESLRYRSQVGKVQIYPSYQRLVLKMTCEAGEKKEGEEERAFFFLGGEKPSL